MTAQPESLDGEVITSARLIMSQDEIDADRDRWKGERRWTPHGDGPPAWRLTASEMASVIGLAPPAHGSAYSLYYAKTDGQETFQGSDRTELGLYLENLVASRFTATHPELELGPGGL